MYIANAFRQASSLVRPASCMSRFRFAYAYAASRGMASVASEGQKVPSDVTFHARKDDDWEKISSGDLFQGKKVIMFALPGAFTPTCSAKHLPRFEALASDFKKEGIDDIYCLAVNDGFVMKSWAEDLDIHSVKLIPDGNGEFSEKMGLLKDFSAIGFGKRSWRYSMLVNDGKIEKMFVEPEKPGDPFEVSDADTMLKHINPDAQPSEPTCPA